MEVIIKNADGKNINPFVMAYISAKKDMKISERAKVRANKKPALTVDKRERLHTQLEKLVHSVYGEKKVSKKKQNELASFIEATLKQ
jgi:hypothetical protein